ncbi:MAG TPA: ACT domain-containing protein [Thermodesulfovibrionales bacterium]|nr:ACT domain-containing protein [Thermodesulfovibrionales bacterium]
MAKAKKVKQLSFEMPDRPGLLSEVTSAVSEAKVNITAICAYGMEGKAYFMLTTDSNAAAKKRLAKLGVTTKEEEVFAVEMANKAGELRNAAKALAGAGININYMYGTAAAGKTAVCVFSTSDDKKAIKAINK